MLKKVYSLVFFIKNLKMKTIYFLFSFIVMSTVVWGQNELQLTLPPHIYCNPHAEISLYYDNVIYNPDSIQYIFRIRRKLGIDHSDKFTFDTGRKSSCHSRFRVKVFDQFGSLVASEKSIVHFNIVKSIPADTTKILIIGNSLTARGIYSAKVQSYLSDSLHFPVKFLGTKASNGGIHEGYGGKTWEWLAKHGDSPFVIHTTDNDSILNFEHYFTDVIHEAPDVVVIFLGINDCFRADTTSIETIDKTIDEMLENTTFFLSRLIDNNPELQIGVCLTPPANDRQEAFRINYGDKYTQSGWEKIQHRLVQRYIAFFRHNFQANCSLIPVEINIDTYNGYPDNNGVHPNVNGYNQIAASIFNWIYSLFGNKNQEQ